MYDVLDALATEEVAELVDAAVGALVCVLVEAEVPEALAVEFVCEAEVDVVAVSEEVLDAEEVDCAVSFGGFWLHPASSANRMVALNAADFTFSPAAKAPLR